ncbi:TetR/AcrR family transcriptional regulator [Gordonia paraffinivorans]|nr:TetR/AcrR family transcriptional regulator [Gordonia paraffinivorans]
MTREQMSTAATRGGDRTQQRRTELLDAFLALCVERGYREIGVGDVVARAGVSHGTFYNYFDNKRDALAALMTREVNDIVAVVELHRTPAATLEEFTDELRSLAARILEYALRRPAELAFLTMEAPGVDDAALQEMLSYYHRMSSLSADYLQEGVDAGYLRGDIDVEVVGEIVVSGLVGLLIPVLLEPDQEIDIEASASTFARFLLYGGWPADA